MERDSGIMVESGGQPEGRLRRRWILIIALSLVLAGMVPMAVAQESVDESRLIKRLALLGGSVSHDGTMSAGPVVAVVIDHKCRFNDKYLHLLKGFPSLQSLELAFHHFEDADQFTDAGASHLGELKGLTNLSLTYTKITDAGLGELGKLTSLARLDLSHTRVTAAGLKELHNLDQLSTLTLQQLQIKMLAQTEL